MNGKKISSLWMGLVFLIGLTGTAAYCPAYGAQGHIIIDPGHGGRDSGVELSRSLSEADYTLAVAQKIQENLAKKKSIKVTLTRTGDRDLTIGERKKIAAAARADLFISLHVNAGFGMKSSGYEIYFRGFEQAGSDNDSSQKVVNDMLETRYLNDSIRYSNLVEKELGKIFVRQGRGLRGAPAAVLEGLEMPAVLIELGFATNPKNREKLLEKTVKDDIARALSKSIEEYMAKAGSQ